MAISWYNLSYCTVFSDFVPGDCHVRALPFLAMTVVVDTWVPISKIGEMRRLIHNILWSSKKAAGNFTKIF